MKNVLMEEISLRDIIQTKDDIISKIADPRELFSRPILELKLQK